MKPIISIEIQRRTVKPHKVVGDIDALCLFCGHWCTDKSSCSNRFHVAQGDFVSDGTKLKEEMKVFYFCDECFIENSLYDFFNLPAIVFENGDEFYIDTINRMND